ncbi:MAG: hypothetical protein DI637_06085 [Citromicrobium sp.]|nr:MAG: hypothetical protein DI637_06085 [Citromicrobium sp.]
MKGPTPEPASVVSASDPARGTMPPTGTYSFESKEERTAVLRRQGFSETQIASMDRNETKRRWTALILLVLILAAAAVAFFLFSRDIEQNDRFERPAEDDDGMADLPYTWGSSDFEQPPVEASEPKEVAAEPAPAPAPTSAARQRRPARATGGEAGNTVATRPAPAPVTTLSFAGPDPDSVDRETQRALRSGESQMWDEDGMRGYVLVSGEVQYGDYTCRRVSYSRIFDNNQQATSSSRQWCREGRRGRWRVDSRGPG